MRHVLDRLPSCAILDGGVGTELIARGIRAGAACPEAWNVDRAGEVRDLHSAYFAAGADVVQSNTFGGTRLRLAAFGHQADVRSFNLIGALLAREARPADRREALVVGDLGPTGAVPP